MDSPAGGSDIVSAGPTGAYSSTKTATGIGPSLSPSRYALSAPASSVGVIAVGPLWRLPLMLLEVVNEIV